ncbi:hypothetical protein [Haloferax sp. DFSO60]|uniref:hypothetical protein n=1 Tax=Haloferax sp. DFSO60 TaxID=3388652 RepID=UPI00397A1EF7
MDEEPNMGRAFGKYLLILFASLTMSFISMLPFEQRAEPGTFPRLVMVLTFFTVFTLLFLWDAGYLKR